MSWLHVPQKYHYLEISIGVLLDILKCFYVYNVCCYISCLLVLVKNENLQSIYRFNSRHSNVELSMREHWVGQILTDTWHWLSLTLVDCHCKWYNDRKLSSIHLEGKSCIWRIHIHAVYQHFLPNTIPIQSNTFYEMFSQHCCMQPWWEVTRNDKHLLLLETFDRLLFSHLLNDRKYTMEYQSLKRRFLSLLRMSLCNLFLKKTENLLHLPSIYPQTFLEVL